MKWLIGLAAYLVIIGLPSTGVRAAATLSADDIEAIGRTAYAESGSFLGRLGVVETILNRLHDGRFGKSVQQVIDAPWQFEPVARVGGSWRNLPPLSAAQRKDIVELIWVHEQGTLTIAKGATFFQNERVVADRAARGRVKPELVGFDGMKKVSEWRDGHSFYIPDDARHNKVHKPNGSVKVPAQQTSKPRVSMMVFGGD